jgi:hypothetical protein
MREVTNMIVGRAKSNLKHLAMTPAPPTVITGTNRVISFGSPTPRIFIPYGASGATSPWRRAWRSTLVVEQADEA